MMSSDFVIGVDKINKLLNSAKRIRSIWHSVLLKEKIKIFMQPQSFVEAKISATVIWKSFNGALLHLSQI